MKITEALRYITIALYFCNCRYCINCSNREVCMKVFGSSFVSQEFLELAKKCKTFVEEGHIGEEKSGEKFL